MPTYAYACKQCGHHFDAVQSFADAALTECPQCGGELRKQYGSIGVTFNGPGFYRTDSRAGGSSAKTAHSGSSSSAKSSPSTSSGSGDGGATSASSTSGASSSSAAAS